MDIDATEIQIRVRQPDGSDALHTMLRQDLVALIEQTALDMVTSLVAIACAARSAVQTESDSDEPRFSAMA
jgi:hypothetical protein